jgi:hypothetical protein
MLWQGSEHASMRIPIERMREPYIAVGHVVHEGGGERLEIFTLKHDLWIFNEFKANYWTASQHFQRNRSYFAKGICNNITVERVHPIFPQPSKSVKSGKIQLTIRKGGKQRDLILNSREKFFPHSFPDLKRLLQEAGMIYTCDHFNVNFKWF